ncbi:MAG TPA: hypothetical protein VLZ89_16645 [Anaerolineales bacterium]|nr:hypothetical protein [Anaerolineales bacterium]
MRAKVFIFTLVLSAVFAVFVSGPAPRAQALDQPTIPGGRLDPPPKGSGTLDFSGYRGSPDPRVGPAFKPQNPSASLTLGIPNTWLHLPSSDPGQLFPTGFVYAIAFHGNDVYVGGALTLTPGGGESDILRFNTTTNTWSAMPNLGLTGDVKSLAMNGSDLYVGGRFVQTADGAITLNHIARFDTLSGTWHALPDDGLNGAAYASEVDAITFLGTKLYVAGQSFTQTADGNVTDLNNIAVLDTSTGTWSALPGNGLGGPGYSVTALAAKGTDLYAGGFFTSTADGLMSLNHIARFDTATATWHALPDGGLSDEVDAMVFNGNDLYVGGWFSQTADGQVGNLNGIARLDTATGSWSDLSNGLERQSDACAPQPSCPGVLSLIFRGSDLYAGGFITGNFDNTVTGLNGIARYDTLTSTWHALPHNGLAYGPYPADVHALALIQNELYVGGHITQTFDGALPLNGIAVLFQDLAPTGISLSNSKIDGNQPIGITVGTLGSIDPNVEDSFTYSLCGGPDDRSFAIRGGSYQTSASTLATAASLFYSVKKSYSICIRSTDAGGLTFTQHFIITLYPALESIGSNDGFILESGPASNAGGSTDSSSWSLNVGDDELDRQYVSILSFNTAALPQNATLTHATLQIRYENQVGNPFPALGNILVDIQRGSFSNNAALQPGDFQAPPGESAIGTLTSIMRSCGPACQETGWYALDLGPSAIAYINRTGMTQLRLRFQMSTNNDHAADYITFYSGNVPEYSRPILIIEYRLPGRIGS